MFPFRDTRLPQVPLIPIVYGVRAFGVEQKTEGFLPQSVALQLELPRIRLFLGIFRLEQAISEFDWLFTPIPES